MGSDTLRRARLGVVAAVAVAAVVAVALVLHRGRDVAGTNSVAPSDRVAAVPAGGRLCVSHLWLPAGAASVSLQLATAAPGGAGVGLRLDGPAGTVASRARVPAGGAQSVSFPFAAARTAGPASLCLRPDAPLTRVGGTRTDPFPGVNYSPRPLPFDRVPEATLDGRALTDLVAVEFHWPGSRSAASQLGAATHRAALFRPGFVGAWTYVMLLVLVPLLGATAVVLVVRHTREPAA